MSKRTHELLHNESSPSGTIVGVGSVESQFLIQTVPCVTDYTDADLAPIMVYIEYLCALEVRNKIHDLKHETFTNQHKNIFYCKYSSQGLQKNPNPHI